MSMIDAFNSVPDPLKSTVSFLFQDAGDQVFAIDPGNSLSVLTVDVVDNEQHDWQNEATSYPVEGLENITDNIRGLPDELAVSCFVSNTPVAGLIDTATNFADRMLNGRNRCALAFNKLLELRKLQIPVTVRTRYRVYTNVAISGITITRQPENGESLTFDVRFKAINIVKTQTAKVPAGLGKQDDSATKKRAAVKVDAGKSNGKTVKPADAPKVVKEAAKKATALKAAVNALGG